MIYGQDEPVALPVIDLYDSAMMQMYLNSVRAQYNTAKEEQKEFLKSYGDFYSPFVKDNEYWYNNTMAPVQQLMLDAASRGIDLTRSAEGRALLASTMRNIPYAKLALLKRNAAAGEEYLKNRAALQRAGKYNPLFEQYILEQQGIPSFEDWDSATMGAWTRTSPEEYKDLHDSTYQWVDNNKKRFLGMSPDNKYQMWGVSDDDIRSSLTPHLSGFIGNSLGGYHLANARREVLAEDPTLRGDRLELAAMKRLQDNIVQANREYTYQEIQADPYAQQDRKFAQQMRMEKMKEDAADRRQARAEQHAWNLARAKGEIKDVLDQPMSFSEQTDYGSMQNKATNLGTDAGGRVLDVKNKEVVGNLGKVDANIRSIIKFNENMHNARKNDVYHKKIADFWKSLYTNGHLDPDKMAKRKVLRADGTLDKAYFRAYNKTLAPSMVNAKTDEQFINAAHNYYNTMTFKVPQGSELNKTARKVLFGNVEGKYNGVGNKYKQIQLDNTYYYTPVREATVSPTQAKVNVTLRKNNIYDEFNKFLRNSNITAWEAPGERNTETALIERPGGVVERDFSGYISVPKKTIQKFLDDHVKGDARAADYAELYRKLNLKVYNAQSQEITKDTQKGPGRSWTDVEFVQIPITRVIDNNNTTILAEYDREYDKAAFGANTSYKIIGNRQNNSLNR